MLRRAVAVLLMLAVPVAARAALPAGFHRSTVLTGLTEPTTLAFTPDGRLLVGERGGRILVIENGVPLSQPLLQIDANTVNGERGLVGLAVDPSFASNGWVYAYYTSQEPRNRVGRFTVIGNKASPASELIVWQNPELATDYHHGGAIRFGPDGNLYIATGDQFDSANAQDLTNDHGKILRVRRNGAIPGDNPFIGVPGAQPEIWAYGLRNPFRFTFDATTGAMWIGDVGGNSHDSWEELNPGIAGANYGWPDQEGLVCYVPSCAGYVYPVHAYRHDDPAYFHFEPQGSIILGPVYRAGAFPQAYQGSLLFGDYANRWIRRAVIGGTGTVLGDPLFDSDPDAGTIVDLAVGPDGAVYYANIGIPWSGAFDTPAVYRIAYAGGSNQPPTAVAAGDVSSGLPPLTVHFTGSGSVDPDGGPQALTYAWAFGDGATSSLADPQHTYTTAGQYQAVLTVSDGAVGVSADPITVRVGRPPAATITMPAPATRYRAGDVIAFAGTGSDAEDGVLGPAAFSWQVVLRHAAHTHPALGPLAGVQQGSLTIPASGHAPEDSHFEIALTVTDSDGLTDTVTLALVPQTATLQLTTSPVGVPVFLDGEAEATPFAVASLAGFQHLVEAQAFFVLGGTPYLFADWADGGVRSRLYTVPDGGGALTARYVVAPAGCTGDADADGVCDERDDCPNAPDPAQRDTDGDGRGDACDVCTITSDPQRLWRSASVSATRINDGRFGNDRLALSGQFTVAGGALGADPSLLGARVEVRSESDAARVDIVLPPGPYVAPGPGWSVNRARTRFTFRDRRPGGTGGLILFTVRDKGGGEVQFSGSGNAGGFPLTPADAPLRLGVSFGDAAASTAGKCGEAAFALDACRSNGAATRLACRESRRPPRRRAADAATLGPAAASTTR